MSRLWSDPPLKPDGTLDYSQLALAEICEDLSESLLDLVWNGGQKELAPFLDDIPDVEEIPSSGEPTPKLVDLMEALLQREADDHNFQTPASRELINQAVRELRKLSDKTT